MTSNLPDSFKEARKNFAANLEKVMDHFGYSPVTLSLKLSMSCSSDVVPAGDVYSWLLGNKIPNVYHLYKLSNFFGISMGDLFVNDLDPNEINGKSFAKQVVKYLVTDEPISNPSLSESIQMPIVTNKNTVVTVAASSWKRMEQVVTSHTSKKNYNILLANKLYSSNIRLCEIASAVGISTRSLRDYAFGGASVPKDVAKNLVKLFKTTYKNLGLGFNPETQRYSRLTVQIKS